MSLGSNTDLDFDVVRLVFKVDPESYRWGVPYFSEDRNSAAMVNTEMAFLEDGSRDRYEKELEHRAIDLGWKSKPEWSGIAILLCVLLPEEICKAAVMACRGSGIEAAPSSTDKDRRQCHEIAPAGSSGYRSTGL